MNAFVHKIFTDTIIWGTKNENDTLIANVNFERGNQFYFACEKEMNRPVSIYFPNWDWVKERFGENAERLNDGRLHEIEEYKKAIKYRLPMFELSNLKNYDESTGKFFKQDEASQKNKFIEAKLIEYYPQRLSSDAIKRFQDHVDKGLYVLCQLIQREKS
jgi:hypothetical protein